ncbi:MAG: DUF72 domain-containing protein [Pseudomonadota bacterium]
MRKEIRAGTSGYSYKEWQGTFYPETLPKEDWLTYYATQLPAVEINNTFYRMPKEHVVAAWRDAVPDEFKFVLKASRRITHQSRLKNADEATGYLIKRARVLDSKLGALLFQLPPYMRADTERLQRFQDLLPQDLPCVFEFRHESWHEADVRHYLDQRGHGWVVTHDEDTPKLAFHSTGTINYLRLRANNYTLPQLQKWHRMVSQTNKESFVFFKHEEAGAGPALAEKFLHLTKPVPKAAAKKAVNKAKPARAARKSNPRPSKSQKQR